MVKLINLQGGITYVAENRVDEYLEAGFKLASKPIEKPEKEEKTEEVEKPKRKVTKKK